MCEEMHIKFIGPSAEIMDKMGDKINARAEMIAANVPVIPGSDGEVFTAEEALEVADRLGYPVMLKLLLVAVVKEFEKSNLQKNLYLPLNQLHKKLWRLSVTVPCTSKKSSIQLDTSKFKF